MRIAIGFWLILLVPVLAIAMAESPRARYDRERLRYIEFQNYSEKVGVSAQSRARAKELFVRAHNRHLAAIIRLEQIADRIEGRIITLEASGENVTQLRLKLASLRTLLQEARAGLDASKEQFENIKPSSIQELSGSVKPKVEQAHRGLIQLIFLNNHASEN